MLQKCVPHKRKVAYGLFRDDPLLKDRHLDPFGWSLQLPLPEAELWSNIPAHSIQARLLQGRVGFCIEVSDCCHFHIIITRKSEIVLKVTSWCLAIVDCVDEPKVVDDSIFEEALGIVEDDVDLCLFHGRDNAFAGFSLCPSIILHHHQVSVKLLCDTEPDFILANLSPVEKVKFIDGEGHLIIVRVVRF